ncbi:hypothetical protein ACJRO7_027814 [Eucalyptus globulus]|uniref:Uncharacterized protein n=1 Tax=Eucalyptus globulus TaxID=34317 RepID=A0ABD3JYC3_EUCGL
MGYHHHHYQKCRPYQKCGPPGPMPYPVLLFLALVFLFIALSKLISFELFQPPEIKINWALLFVPIAILALVQWLSSPCCSRRNTRRCNCR